MRRRFSQPKSTGNLITIARDGYELVVAPGFGGRIVTLRHRGRDLLRPTPASVVAEPLVYGFAGFPLMPYSGPLFGPGFSFGGVEHVLWRNVAEEPSATHGDAWTSAFSIRRQTPDALDLTLDFEPSEGAYPFRWRGDLGFSLAGNGLTISLAVTSRDHRPMPAGIGFHPYFPKPPGTRLRFSSLGVWPPDAPEAVALGCGPLEDGLDFADGPDVSEMVVDRLYEGWDGRAEVIAPDGHVTLIEADGALDRLQIYSAWDYPYVCVEPVSNANDGFNRMSAGVPNHGLRILGPNKSVSGTIRIAAASSRQAHQGDGT